MRLHLFEFNDLAWLPGWFRDLETDYLHTVLVRTKPFDRVAPLLAELVDGAGKARFVDLCSGGGGPWPTVRERLREDHGVESEVLLTDRFPSHAAFERLCVGEPGLAYASEPVDALRVPPELSGARTLFDALHHFRPAEARRILEDARRSGAPIAAFEVAQRHPLTILASPLIVLLVLLVTPLCRPFSWRRLLFTYLLPVLPLAIWWDGLVSNLRCHRVAELEAMTRDLCGPDYVFRAGTLGPLSQRVTFVMGRPRGHTGGSP